MDEAVAGLAEYIVELCTTSRNPPRDPLKPRSAPADCLYFKHAHAALLELKKGEETQTRAKFVETSVSRVVWYTLENAWRYNRLNCIEGPPGFGKSFAAKAWCELHSGEARYVRLSGITTRGTFFENLGQELLGLPPNHSGPDKLERNIRKFLRASRVMLVIDEAQNLIPAREKSKRRPELLDWLAGETYDEAIPCTLLTWHDFAVRRAAAEENAKWNPEHLRGRFGIYKRLTSAPTADDFRAVAKAMLPEASDEVFDAIAGYALSSDRHMRAVADVVIDARDLTRARNGKRVTVADVEMAIENVRAVSDAARLRP